MNETFYALVQFPPIPLERPRFSKGKVYNRQNKILMELGKLIELQIKKKFAKPIKIDITFFMRIPKGKPGLKGKPHFFRPDLSNLIKFVEDAMNGRIYPDDSIIAEITAKKIYGENPSIQIEIKEI